MPPETHALLSASSAERWLVCTPSARLCESRPDTQSVYAAEGQLAHSMGELKLKKNYTLMKPSFYKAEIAKIMANELYNDEIDSCTDEYKEYIQEVYLRYKSKPYITFEQRVTYDDYAPEGFGTSDCIMLAEKDLHVFDYKHGKGVAKSAEDNPQMKLYALGAYKRYGMLYPIENVILHIIQPRAGGISEWSLPLTDLLAWGENVVKPAAQKAFAGIGDCAAGDHCRFCSISDTCRTCHDRFRKITELPSFGALPPEITNDEVGELLTLAEGITNWYNKLKDYATEALLKGENIAGYKLVEGRSTRRWDDQLAAFADIMQNGVAEAMLYERKPLTVAALEKSLGKKQFADVAQAHVVKENGKPTITKSTDKRSEYNTAQADFKDLIKE